jgi:tRNA nucleotidyltransferase/poly(A) polymerase
MAGPVLRAVKGLARAQKCRVYLVGGPLRDRLLGKRSLDIDIAADGDVQRFGRRLARTLHGEFHYYDAFHTGTVTLPGGRHVDLARTRTETYSRPAVLPQVKASDINADLARRDFTINAMAWDLLANRLIDPFDGRADLARGIVRVLHERSFEDDPTRIFRAIRFSTRLGFRLLPDTARQLRSAVRAGHVRLLTGRRLLNELELIAAEPAGAAILRTLHRYRVLRIPGSGYRQLARLKALRPELRLLGLLAVVLTGEARRTSRKQANAMNSVELPLTREQSDDIAAIRRFPRFRPRLRHARRPSQVFAALSPFTPNSLRVWENRLPVGLQTKVRAYLDTYVHCVPRLRGQDLKELGIKSGPVYARILERLRRARLDGKTRTRADELKLVRRWMN